MSPHLADFLTRLFATPAEARKMPDAGETCTRLFYRYLDAVGVEHCNFGGFELDEGAGKVNAFSGSRLPEPFLEEFVAELSGEDYVLLKAGELDAARPVSTFNVGLPWLDELRAFNPGSERGQVECARHGIEDGVAMIGQSPMAPGSDRERFFGFVFAGTNGSGERAREMFGELQVASFAMLDRMRPQIDAMMDGFEYDLSDRERDVLGALALGLQRSEIAHRMNLSVPTIDLYLRQLRGKLRAQTLAEAVAKGYRYGIL
ncbi:response regulator transcription factor [Aurantiacibacter poecillastricola]|uniref:response regulator transcription factor n=1 Tax=Aurantiacibacter poecillastricola TaxID=3064385 RepID=UPI00273D5447|nr:LuxR family transcriptional regulator [Aurantiacibacter sp. 219JJ12-13]MDP5260866.1 LuxR C-terminal-related transcriptional regulator [Aurantiacibacter sp. 219JJ12-13]